MLISFYIHYALSLLYIINMYIIFDIVIHVDISQLAKLKKIIKNVNGILVITTNDLQFYHNFERTRYNFIINKFIGVIPRP